MKERPILFSSPMVRAILEGRKSMTRRVVKPQPADVWPADGQEMSSPNGLVRYYAEDVTASIINGTLFYGCPGYAIGDWRCPYGIPGDRLWVKEKHSFNDVMKSATPGCWCVDVEYSDGFERNILAETKKPKQTRERGEIGWRSSIHMPRWASRILLEITDVRVERLQEISDKDAMREGADQWGDNDGAFRHGFRLIWESINGPGSWDENPWVWVVCFKRIE